MPKVKSKSQMCPSVRQVKEYTKAPSEMKTRFAGGQPARLEIIPFHMCKMMVIFSLACILTGFLAIQTPASMVGTSWCHLHLDLRDQISSISLPR